MNWRREASWDAYVDRLAGYLTEEFGWDGHVNEAFKGHMHRTDPSRLEWICDDPAASNWRLKPVTHDRPHPWALRMAHYGVGTDTLPRQQRINGDLACILREETGA